MNKSVSSIRDYLRIVFRRKLVLFVPIVLGILLIGPVVFVMPKKYRAVALIKYKQIAALRDDRTEPLISVKTLRGQILRWQNLKALIHKLNLDLTLHTNREWQQKYAELANAIHIEEAESDRDTQLIRIAATMPDPELAEQIANTIANQYAEEALGTKRGGLTNALLFNQQQMEDHRGKMVELSSELAVFREKSYEDLPEVKLRYLDRRSQIETERKSHEIQLKAAKATREKIETQLAEVPIAIKTTVPAAESAEVTEIGKQLAMRQQVLDALLIEFTDDHPDVKQIRQEIFKLEGQIASLKKEARGIEVQVANPNYTELLRDKDQIEQQIKALEATVVQLEANFAVINEKIGEVQKEESKYLKLARQHKQETELYEQYRRAHKRIQDQLAALEFRQPRQEGVSSEGEPRKEGIRVDVYPAFVPATPYRKVHVTYALLCLAGGAAVGVALMLTLEFCDHSLRSVEDAAQFLQIPVLGSISAIVPSDEIKRRRRNRLIFIAVVVLSLAGVGGGWYLLDPVTFEQFFSASVLDFFSDIKEKLIG